MDETRSLNQGRFNRRCIASLSTQWAKNSQRSGDVLWDPSQCPSVFILLPCYFLLREVVGSKIAHQYEPPKYPCVFDDLLKLHTRVGACCVHNGVCQVQERMDVLVCGFLALRGVLN
jgi:hypothetical protein